MGVIADSDLREHLGFPLDDDVDDLTVTAAVNATNTAIVRMCRRSFDTDTNATARVYYPATSHLVRLDDFHTTDSLVVKTDTSDDGTYDTTWMSADYVVEPLNGMVDGASVPYNRLRSVEAKTFPVAGHRPSVEVTAKWGWASVPSDVHLAGRIMGSRLFRRKDSPEASMGFGEFALRLAREDPDVVPLLRPYIKTPVLV